MKVKVNFGFTTGHLMQPCYTSNLLNGHLSHLIVAKGCLNLRT